MNINIIDYNGISIWTMCSKTKSWKTHYVTRGLGAPMDKGKLTNNNGNFFSRGNILLGSPIDVIMEKNTDEWSCTSR